ncbi:MAG: hypothetical protein OEL77_06990 [Nitrosopumilus sp.]|nr:hypothetical protein [Nitrosopumilus sp.]MDH3385741.1 hypothetical protein [Nitrosopumilus sp.]
MGLSIPNLTALRVFSPASILDNSLGFFEFLRYETKSIRDETIISKNDILELISKSTKIKQSGKTKKSEITTQFDEFTKKLDKSLFIKKENEEFSDIQWKKIDDFCNLLRLIERSDERKIRWALYHFFISGKTRISKDEISNLLKDFKIKNLDRTLSKIIKEETLSGLDAEFDGKTFIINHGIEDKLVFHYLADAIAEPSRRSPGDLEQEILKLIDEGSFSNQEISKALVIDEGLVSRTIGKLRDQEKITLSSFGQRGARYFTTNCDNCPFGTTKTSCRKEALSYIISTFKEDFGLNLTMKDFDSVETNQALLKIKRIVMMARKEKTTKLEMNISENLDFLLSKAVEKFIELESPKKNTIKLPEIKIKETSNLANLPMLYQLGLKKGAKEGIHLMDNILRFASKSTTKEDRIKVRKHAQSEINKFLKNIGLNEKIPN